MPADSALSLADVIRAVATLRPDAAATREVVRLLGFEVAEPETSQRDTSSETKGSTSGANTTRKADRPPRTQAPSPEPEARVVPSTLEVERSASTEPIEVAASVPPLERERSSGLDAPMPRPSLFDPVWERALLSSALATASDDGPLDLDRLIDRVARREPVDRLPRQPWPTLRRGVHLLLDQSEGMSLFADDLAMLHRRLKEVVGRDAVTARPFVGRPRGDRSTPPPAGTPVLAATDLGIARPLFSEVDVEPGDWLAFADDLRRAGCPLVAFVPYGPGRWPSALLGAFPILQWDRTTTVSTVLARIGRSLSL